MAKKSVESIEGLSATVSQADLVAAIKQVVEAGRDPVKKNAFTRKKNTPWTPKDGAPKLKLKRRTYQHGIELGDTISNEEVALCNKLRPGIFCDGWVRVIRRRDKGIDVDYPIKTASQRLKLGSTFGINSFEDLLKRLVAEGENPKNYVSTDDLDD